MPHENEKVFLFRKKKNEICFSKLAHFGVKRERADGLSKQINLLVFYVAKKRSDLKMEIKLRVSSAHEEAFLCLSRNNELSFAFNIRVYLAASTKMSCFFLVSLL